MQLEDTTQFKISVPNAITFAQTWRQAKKNEPYFVKSFTVSADELMSILNEMQNLYSDINAVRFYMGLKPDISTGQLVPCLVMVGVQNFGNTTNPPGTDVIDLPDHLHIHNPLHDSLCYDFAFPCPDTCAINSPLL